MTHLLCETLEVSTAGHYAWRQRPTSSQEQRRTALVAEIRAWTFQNGVVNLCEAANAC